VPEAERELVFQPFYRALGSEADGSGLGLPIVRRSPASMAGRCCWKMRIRASPAGRTLHRALQGMPAAAA
jgi:K+-sensing histidine kinase KdpD